MSTHRKTLPALLVGGAVTAAVFATMSPATAAPNNNPTAKVVNTGQGTGGAIRVAHGATGIATLGVGDDQVGHSIRSSSAMRVSDGGWEICYTAGWGWVQVDGDDPEVDAWTVARC